MNSSFHLHPSSLHFHALEQVAFAHTRLRRNRRVSAHIRVVEAREAHDQSQQAVRGRAACQLAFVAGDGSLAHLGGRSEERRVGKECRSRWSPYHSKKKRMLN